MIVDKYTNAVSEKMEFTLCIVSNELSKIEKYAKGLSWEYLVLVHQAPTFEAVIQATKSFENMNKGGFADRVEVAKKRKTKGFQETKTTTTRSRSSRSQTTTNLEAAKKGSGTTNERRIILATVSLDSSERSQGIYLQIAK